MTKDNIFYLNERTLVKKLLIIDGLTRSGKYLLGKIMAGFQNMDYFQAISVLEQIPFIRRVGGMSEDAAIILFRKILDEHAYNIRIGRNLNTRISDASSIYNSPDYGEYIKRTISQHGEIRANAKQVIKSFQEGDRWAVFLTHETLPNVDTLFKAYPNLRMINLLRHPVDLIYSWYLRGWGKRFGNDPLNFTPSLKNMSCPVPWYAYKWKEEYKKSSEIDRVIRSVATLIDMSEQAYNALKKEDKKKIFFVHYEKIVETPNCEIERICKFLDTELKDGMPVILARERCPKEISLKERKSKLNIIKKKATKKMFRMLLGLAHKYEK